MGLTSKLVVLAAFCGGVSEAQTPPVQTEIIDLVTPVIDLQSTDAEGYNIFRLYLTLGGNADSLYAIYGGVQSEGETLLDIPAARQDAMMSVDLGGVNPMYYAMIESSQYDSWLTIGIDSGNAGELASTGLDFSTWNEHSRLVSDPVAGGSVFWLDPQSAPNRADTDGTGLDAPNTTPGDTFLVAQLAMSSTVTQWSASMMAQGYETPNATAPNGPHSWHSWEDTSVVFCYNPSMGNDCTGSGGPAPEPPPPAPPTSGVQVTCGPGQHPSSGGTACVDCVGHMYSPTGESCSACQPGFQVMDPNGPDHVACTACAPGLYSDNGVECAVCPPGRMPDGGQVACVADPSAQTGVQTEIDDHAVQPFVEVLETGPIAGTSSPGTDSWTTYRLSIGAVLGSDAINVYTIFGETVDSQPYTMHFPPAWQLDPPFGQSIGGIDPSMYSFEPNCRRDSWLTVGPVDASQSDAIALTPGLNLDSWTTSTGLTSANGALLWTDPDVAPQFLGNTHVVVAQLTLQDSLGPQSAIINAQGRTIHGMGQGQNTNIYEGHDWKEFNIQFHMGGGSAPPSPPSPVFTQQGALCGQDTVCNPNPIALSCQPNGQASYCVQIVAQGEDCSDQTMVHCGVGATCDETMKCTHPDGHADTNHQTVNNPPPPPSSAGQQSPQDDSSSTGTIVVVLLLLGLVAGGGFFGYQKMQEGKGGMSSMYGNSAITDDQL